MSLVHYDCSQCGKPTVRQSSSLRSARGLRFCSPQCAGAHRRGKNIHQTGDRSDWGQFVCAWCKVAFERKRSSIKNDTPACSYVCSAKIRIHLKGIKATPPRPVKRDPSRCSCGAVIARRGKMCMPCSLVKRTRDPSKATKFCRGCARDLPVSSFQRRRERGGGLRSRCNECGNRRLSEWRRSDSPIVAAYRMRAAQSAERYRKTERGREVARAAGLRSRRKNIVARRERDARRRRENRQQMREAERRYRERHREQWRAKFRRRRQRVEVRLNASFRRRLADSIKGRKSGRPWESLVGYTIADLLAHLEARFQPGMTWENYGTWHIDHIRPLASFAFVAPEEPEFLEAWGLSNLQPLWAIDNIRKGARWAA